MLPDSFSQLIHLEFIDLSCCEMLSSLPDDFGNLTSLKYINLSFWKQLSMLPDSFSQLIHLEFLDLSSCEMLSSLPNGFDNLISLRGLNLEYCELLSSLPETLPVSLKILKISKCNLLENIRCISDLINLESLYIDNCVQIEELPSFADLASLNNFYMSNCPKAEKIEGLEHAKSLKQLELKTHWKVPGIQSLENVERLEDLGLKCDTISALKPCIQSLKGKECPRRMLIQGSVTGSVEAIVKSLEFPDLAVRRMGKVPDEYKIPCAKHLDAFLCYVEGNDEKEVRVYYGWDFPYYYDFPITMTFREVKQE